MNTYNYIIHTVERSMEGEVGWIFYNLENNVDGGGRHKNFQLLPLFQNEAAWVENEARTRTPPQILGFGPHLKNSIYYIEFIFSVLCL